MSSDISTPLLQFLKWEKEIPDQVFLRQPFGDEWKTWTWVQAGMEARKMTAALSSLGLVKGDHVAVLSKNCAQWIIADLAIMMGGFISIPIYPTLTAHSIKPILEHSDSKLIILGKLDDYSTQKDGIPDGMKVISMETWGLQEGHLWEKLISEASPVTEVYPWKPEEILSIIYTSGTTGKSKGVMHRVSAFDAVLQVAIPTLGLPQRPDLFSYLPLSHIAERIGIEMNAYYTGGCISFAESIETFPKNVASVQPHLFFAVPRIWGKLREGILKKLPQKKLSFLLSIPLISQIIRKKIRKKLGLSRARHCYSAAAPISVELLEWFEKLGIIIYQAYGMTEDCVYSHFEKPGDHHFGKVGKPFPGLQVKIAEDGEIRLKSKGNMVGYYKEPEMTAAVFDEEQYFRTGDMGEYDQEGYLSITGRVKDQFKTDKGKYISPAPIETRLLQNTKIEQACVVGTGVPQPMALVTLSEEGKSTGQKQLEEEFTSLLNQINSGLEKFEMLEKIVIINSNWTIENNLLTPTLKVKRNEVEKIHLPAYPGWFQQNPTVIWQ